MFILHTPNSDKPTAIVFKKKLSDGPYKLSLGVKVLPALWNKSAERAIWESSDKELKLDKATINEHKSINTLLDKIEQYVKSRAVDARYTGNHLTGAELTSVLEDLTGKKKYSKTATKFYDQCDAIVEDMATGIILTPDGKVYSPATLKCYKLYLRNIKKYDADITWNAITLDFYRNFIKWCNDNDFSLNYIGQHVNKLIVLMKEARKRGHHSNVVYLDTDFKRLREETDDISITPAELDAIYQKHCPNPLWDVARDWFVIGCHLGLRVSDVKLLNKDLNFMADSVVIVNEKTDTKVVVPINPRIRAIMKKWDGLPPKMTDIEINRYIKKVAEVVKINDTVLYFLTKGGKRQDFYLKKFEMISCHTMRRFFITELLQQHVPDNQVMQLAGIKKHATLLRYKKTKPEETADILKDHKFFK